MLIAIPVTDPTIPYVKELASPFMLLIVDILDTPPVIAEIMLIAIPIKVNMIVIVHAHPLPFKSP